MQVEVKYAPAATAAQCFLQPGETLVSEAGAFMALKGQAQVTTSTHKKQQGSFLKGLKRMLSGESFFLNHFSAEGPAEVWLSTPLPGDIMVHELKGQRLVVAGGGYIASEDSIEIDLEWQGMKSLFSGEGLFWLKAQGQGKLLLGSFGQIYPVNVNGEYIVDTGHIVAFDETLNFNISKVGDSWLHSFLGGEGLICRFQGSGTVWCQSHNPSTFGQLLGPHLKVKKQ